MRIRTIKPSFWTNDEIAELEPLTRLLFIGLWALADVRGRLEDRPKRIKAAVLPYDDHDIDAALDTLEKAGFLIRYDTGDVSVIQVLNFEKHQRISGKEAETESDFPAFDPSIHDVKPGKQRGSSGEAPGISQDSAGFSQNVENPNKTAVLPGKHPGSNGEAPGSPEGKGREGNGKEGKGKEGKGKDTGAGGAPGSRFVPPTREELNLEAAKLGLPPIEVDKFVNYYASNGWKVGKVPMKSWPHALSGWATRWRERAQALNFGGGDNRYQTDTPADAAF